MPYVAEISRINPMCFLFMIDQSTSMKHEISAGDVSQQKCTGVADTVNRWLQELSLKCAKAEGVGDYYHVGVIGYGSNVGSAFMGKLAGQDLVPISEIAENPGRVEDRKRKVPDGSGGVRNLLCNPDRRCGGSRRGPPHRLEQPDPSALHGRDR